GIASMCDRCGGAGCAWCLEEEEEDDLTRERTYRERSKT
ncbi:hypothetical protein LCGC14_1909320, partial [marine sediment metagenome]